ncbi:NAD(P)-binding protein [Xylariaceae sp. FL1272]|nr:NAD(P)-binding protein [Xylariaceae sp. FL1272]
MASTSPNPKKILAVFGATGNQGRSVIDHVLSSSDLSPQYIIRAITRDVNSPAAQALRAKGVQDIVSADLNNPHTLLIALANAHTVFLMTTPDMSLPYPEAKAQELSAAKAATDACVAAGVSYLIFSTLPHVEKGSDGKYKRVAGFDAKAEAEAYMRTRALKTAFFAPGSFMQNWSPRSIHPSPANDGSYIIARPVAPETKLPLIDIAGDTGKFVGAILADPIKYEGKTFCAAARLYSMTEICEIISRATGKRVTYSQITPEQFKGFMRGSPYADILIDMMLYQQDFGYYFDETESAISWAVENARGRVTTFEEFLEREPIVL